MLVLTMQDISLTTFYGLYSTEARWHIGMSSASYTQSVAYRCSNPGKGERNFWIHSQLSRCCTTRGSSSGLSLEDPTKVKARKFLLFTESSLKVENKEHLFDFVVTLYLAKINVLIHSTVRKRTKWEGNNPMETTHSA